MKNKIVRFEPQEDKEQTLQKIASYLEEVKDVLAGIVDEYDEENADADRIDTLTEALDALEDACEAIGDAIE